MFRLPVCYDAHQFGIREQADYIRIVNSGLDTQNFRLSLSPEGPWSTPGGPYPGNGRIPALCYDPADGDELQVYRENDLLRVQQLLDRKAYDVLSILDGSSTLWTVYHGAQAWQRTAKPATAGFS